MMQNISHKIFISFILILFALFSFFYGFYVDEIPMGSGGYNGDFDFVKKSINIFSNNSLNDSILLFSDTSNRTPLIYILHKLLNPFFENSNNYRLIVFFISLIVPVLFFLCLVEKFKKTDKVLLGLLASTIFFNPFYRNSSFWGLEENYAIITCLLSFLFLLKLQKQKIGKPSKIYVYLLLIITNSSLCIYFDQKFLIIPIICFGKIIFSNLSINAKFFTVISYTIFSLPYLFFIYIWGGIFPTNVYSVGNEFFLHHFGFAITIIAFIILPIIILDLKNVNERFKNFLKDKNNFFLILFIVAYVACLIFFYDNSFLLNEFDGGGIVKKLSFFFGDLKIRQFFIYSAIIISWVFISFFIKDLKDRIILIYFFIISVITRPFFQEYFDPIFLFLFIFIFKNDLLFNFNKVLTIYIYLLIFMFGSISYYTYYL